MSLKDIQYNQTAYRILLILLWLSERPHTFPEINQRFKKDPMVGKTVSQDTFWLYINTLKALGCEISRPTPTNGFCYELNYHPFSYYLTPQDLHGLRQALNHIDEGFHYWEIFYFSRWLHRLFKHAANKNRQELAEHFFTDNRIVNFDALETMIRELEMYCKDHQLLHIQYQSPVNGIKQIDFLPQKIFHHQGILYLLGQSADWDKASMLRLDRIISMTPLDNPELHRTLYQKLMHEQVFILRILNYSDSSLEPLGEECEQIVDPTNSEHLLIRFKTDNEFLLKQKLLASGYRFQVLYPESFKLDIQKTLTEMRQFCRT